MNFDSSKIHVVIRGAGERTQKACVDRLNMIFEKNCISLIEEIPFGHALKAGLQIGIKSEKQWLFCIDADVLITNGGVQKLYDVATIQPPNVFEIQGLIVDKFFPVRRPSGGRFYRMAYAKEAIDCIPKEGTSLRPEGTMLREMARRGYPWYQSDVVVGVHDFEQYYCDIFRKCFLHAKKHSYLLPKIMPYWLEQSKEDLDFQVAILAAAYAQAHGGSVSVAKDFGTNEAEKALRELGLEEKDTTVHFKIDQVDEVGNRDFVPGLQELMAPRNILNRITEVPQSKKPSFAKSTVARGFEKMAVILTRMSDSLRKP